MRRITSAEKRGNKLRLLALIMVAVAVLFGATGCYQKLNGGGGSGTTDLPTFGDRFQRANGPLGKSPSGHVWDVTGSGLPAIVDGQYAVPVPASGDYAGYASVNLAPPASIMRARFTLRPGGTTSSIIGLLCNSASKSLLEDVVHVTFSTTYASIQVIDGDLGGTGTLTTLSHRNYASEILPGEYEVSISISGNTVTAVGADGLSHSYTDPRFGAFWGGRQTYEIMNYANPKEMRISAASAGY